MLYVSSLAALLLFATLVFWARSKPEPAPEIPELPIYKDALVLIRLSGADWGKTAKTAVGHVLTVGAGGYYTVLVSNTSEAGSAPKKRKCPFLIGNSYAVPREDCVSVYTREYLMPKLEIQVIPLNMWAGWEREYVRP